MSTNRELRARVAKLDDAYVGPPIGPAQHPPTRHAGSVSIDGPPDLFDDVVEVGRRDTEVALLARADEA